MRHEDKLRKITIKVEFDCYGRTAYIDVELGMNLLTSPLMLRAAIDESIENMLRQHKPVIAN